MSLKLGVVVCDGSKVPLNSARLYMTFFKVLYELHARMYREMSIPDIGCILAIALSGL
jgi:hypothetical protein